MEYIPIHQRYGARRRPKKVMWLRRLIQLVALIMVGDGVVGFFKPRWHSLLWNIGPRMYRDVMQHFAAEPNTARWIYAGEAIIGAWVATRQTPEVEA
jgi:hypothetical protein